MLSKRGFHRLLALALLAGGCLRAQPEIHKVEPPDWWVRHSRNPIQILLTGRNLHGARVTPPPGFVAKTNKVSANGHYAFVYLTVPKTAKPGNYSLELSTQAGKTRVPFPLRAPEATAGGFAGVTPDDVVYLLIPDRFANGDPRNDALAESGPPADRSNPRYYHGGDFAGIEQRLPYLKDLGITALWMLPVYKNSWAGKPPGFFYGYEAADYYDTDPRYGSLADLQRLVRKAHSMGIKVMQDQVANHCGPGHPWVKDPPTATWFNGLDRMPRLKNNFEIAALADPYAPPARKENPIRGWFLGALPDLNQDDPLTRDYLIQNTLWWIAKTGIDGIRQDTYPYVSRAFWQHWQTAIERAYPKLFVTGEITASTPAVLSFFEGGTVREGIDTRLPSMLDFPLQAAIREVFGKGGSMKALSDLLAQDSLYRRPDSLVTFLGNHDIVRFLSVAGGDVQRLMLAQAFLLTTRGIPQLYYGDEIAMGAGDSPKTNTWSKDFPGGFPGDPIDAFTAAGRTGEAATVFHHVQALLRFRQTHPALRTGNLVNLAVEQDRYAYLRSTPQEHVVILLNRGGSATVRLEAGDLPLPEGAIFQSWSSDRMVPVRNGGIEIVNPGEIEILWTKR